VEALDDAIGLRALGLGSRMIDVLDRETELGRFSTKERNTPIRKDIFTPQYSDLGCSQHV